MHKTKLFGYTCPKKVGESNMRSVWQDGVRMPTFSKLEGEHKTEVAIIGGGIAGILLAHRLEAAGVPYVLVERGRIACGTTAHTTGKITAQHGLIYSKIAKKYTGDWARGYYQASRLACEEYRKLAQSAECDLEERDSYVYSTKDRAKLEAEASVLCKLGIPCDLTDDTELPIKTVGAVRMPAQAQFNPLKLLSSISGELNIYENTHVTQLDGGVLHFDGGSLSANTVVVATHFPFINTSGLYFAKMYQHRSYVLGLSGAPIPQGMYVDEDKSGLSFRGYKDMLLLGGGGHRTGKSGGGLAALGRIKEELYPNAVEKYSFAAQDCITLDSMPYVGRYSSKHSNVFCATGFNKWGMSGAMLSAILLCDAIRGVENPYSEIFAPDRSILHPELLLNIFESAKNLLRPTAPRCSHLGCALRWNAAEHSWDCPCHGSRFTEEGALLENPANRDLGRSD